MNQVLGVILGFGFQAFISRTCGADSLGAVTLFLSWLGILSVLTLPGLESSLVYFLPRLDGDIPASRQVLRKCFSVSGTATLLVTAAVALAGPRLFEGIGLPGRARVPLCIALIAFSIGKLFDAMFIAFKDAPAQAYFNNIRTVARFLFCLPALLYPESRWMILFFAVASECIFATILRYMRLRRRYPEMIALAPTSGSTGISRWDFAAIALPMLGVSIIGTVNPLLDKAMLGVMAPLAMVGVYRIGDALASVNSMFVSPFIAFWPYISQFHREDRLDDLRSSYHLITLFIIAVMIPFSLLLIELSPTILSIFGPFFVVHGEGVLLVLAFGTAIDAIAGPAATVLQFTGHARLSVVINAIWLILYFGLSVILIRHYGILGAAMAKAISTVFGNLANLVANRCILGFFPYSAKHAWLLVAAVAIISIRWLLLPSHLGIAWQAIAGLGEASVFIAFTALILKNQIHNLLLPQLRLLIRQSISADAVD